MNFPGEGRECNKNKATDQTEEAHNTHKTKQNGDQPTNQSRLLPTITSHYQPK